MKFRLLARRPSRPAALTACCVLVALVAFAPGCSKEKKSLSDIQEAYDRSDWEETVALCKYNIRRQWDTPRVYYYYGAALVHLGRDYEGFKRLDDGVAKDMSLASDAASFLYDSAVHDLDGGNRSRAARRMQKAIEYDPSLDIGPYRFMVADAYFKEENYGRAAALYKDAVAAYPDTAVVETALFNMATSYDETGWNEQAREAYEALLERFPRGENKSEASWRLANLMYEYAEKQNVLGNYEDAVEVLDRLVTQTTNRGLLQKANYLLGETYEAMEQYGDAYSAYRQVIAVDRGASGRIVELAREKIAALQEAGLH